MIPNKNDIARVFYELNRRYREQNSLKFKTLSAQLQRLHRDKIIYEWIPTEKGTKKNPKRLIKTTNDYLLSHLLGICIDGHYIPPSWLAHSLLNRNPNTEDVNNYIKKWTIPDEFITAPATDNDVVSQELRWNGEIIEQSKHILMRITNYCTEHHLTLSRGAQQLNLSRQNLNSYLNCDYISEYGIHALPASKSSDAEHIVYGSDLMPMIDAYCDSVFLS